MTLSDLRSTSWEDGDGKSYRFKIDTRMNDADSSPVDGIAERTGDHITVKLKQPVPKPSRSTATRCFRPSRSSASSPPREPANRCLNCTVYDGSDNGEKVYNTLTVIGQPIPGDRAIAAPDPSTSNDVMKTHEALAGHRQLFRPRRQDQGGEQTPVYAMSFELYENGVSRALVLDYNDFVIAGAMGKFDVKDSKPCTQAEAPK